MRSDKAEYVSVSMEFTTPNGEVVGSLDRSVLGGMLYDVWTGRMTGGDGNVMAVLAFTAALKTRSDNIKDAE